jgi:putative phosphoesterase
VHTIAVVSDTHDNLPDAIVRAAATADEIWHLGDVCRPDVLHPLELTGRPLVIVRGNCDYTWEWPATCRLERGGRVFHLEHVPPLRPPAGVHYVLHGHTHVPRDEMVLGVRFLNPGCITRPNRGAPASYAWLRIDEQSVQWELVPAR